MILEDVPKRLEIEYFHAIKASDFVKAAEAILADNFTPTQLAAVRAKLDRLNALYEDVKPGDRYALTYVPGRGTELALNGKPKGRVEGADLAKAVFSIWFGTKPLDANLRQELLFCQR